MTENRQSRRREASGWTERVDRYLRFALMAGAVLLVLSQLALRLPAVRQVIVPHERLQGIPYDAG